MDIDYYDIDEENEDDETPDPSTWADYIDDDEDAFFPPNSGITVDDGFQIRNRP